MRWIALSNTAVVVALLLPANGCEALRQGANPDAPLWAKRPGGALRVHMVEPLTITQRSVDEPFERGRPAIDPEHHRVFVGSSDHGLYALRAEDCSTIWRFETLGPVQSEPLYSELDDSVYFGSNDGALYKLRARDGELVWRFNSSAEIERSPLLYRGILYFVNANDTVVAIDPVTGKLRWNEHRSPIGGMSIAGYAGPAASDGRVFVGYSDGHVVAYDAAEGREMWNPPVDLSVETEASSAGYQLPKYFDVDTTPVVDSGSNGPVVYVASYGTGVFALDMPTGSRVWANDRAIGVTELALWKQPAHTPRDGGPTVPERKLLLASSGTSGLWALNTEDGVEIWRRNLPEGGVSAPVSVAGALLVSTTRWGLFLFSPLDGGVIDGIDLGTGFAMTPAAWGVKAYILSNGGSFVALQVSPPSSWPGYAPRTDWVPPSGSGD